VQAEKKDGLRPYVVDVRGNVLVPDDDEQPVSVRAAFRFAEAPRFDLHAAVFLQQGLKQKGRQVCTGNIFTTAVPRSRHTRVWGQGERNETVTPTRHTVASKASCAPGQGEAAAKSF